jgi:hypothetical protein
VGLVAVCISRGDRRGAALALAVATLLATTLACSRGWVEPDTGLVATATPTSFPSPTPPPAYPAPAAYLVVDPAYDTGTLSSLDGHLLAVYDDLGWPNPDPWTGTLVGRLAEPPASTSFVFLATGAEGECLALRSQEGSGCIVPLTDPAGVGGSIPPGFAVVGELMMAAEGAGRTAALVLVDPQALPGQAGREILEREVGADERLFPVGARVEEDAVSEVYYCLGQRLPATPDSPLCRGLFSLHLAAGEVSTVLDPAYDLLGMSPDLRQLASAEEGSPQVQVRRLDASTLVVFQPLAGGRQVAHAVFSPQGTRLAWANRALDGGGQEALSVSLASTFGGPTLQVGQEMIAATSAGQVTALAPAAWLTEDTLLIQAYLEDGPHLFRVSADGSGLVHLSRGLFVGLAYP